MRRFWLVTILLLLGEFAQSNDEGCRRIVASKKPIQQLSNKSVDLSPEQWAILTNHQLTDFFNGKHGINKIQIEPYIYRFRDSDFSGELLQAGFLRSLLKAAGYQGRFIELHPKNFGLRHVLSFSVKDNARDNPTGFNPISPQERSRTVEMSDLKMANGRIRKPNLVQARASLNLPNAAVIAHLYSNIANASNAGRRSSENPDLFKSTQRLFEEGADIVIVSSISRFKGDRNAQAVEFKRKVERSVDQTLYLSELLNKKQRLERSGKILVLNDTSGKMLQLHSASNLALVVGPINFFEALYTGVTTKVLLNDLVLGDYSRVTAEKLLANAEEFPNFYRLKSINDTLIESLAPTDISYNYEAFEDLLDILYKKIQNQLIQQ